MDSFDKELGELKAKYRQAIPQKLAHIRELIDAEKAARTQESSRALRQEVHKISGNAALYDYEEAGTLCRGLDVALQEHSPLSEEVLEKFYKQLQSAFQK